MSYCRFHSGCDVYMYSHSGGFIECYACLLAPKFITNMGDLATVLGCTPETDPEMFEDLEVNESVEIDTRSEALTHLQLHREAGHKVPEYAFEKLRRELEHNGEKIDPIIKDDFESKE